LNLRTATLKDLNELLFIEEQAHHYPWSESTLRWCIEQPHIQCFILQKERELIGFAIYESVIDEATLLNIAVHPFMQGKGFGKQLLQQSLLQLEDGVQKIFLEVRASNVVAQQLYQTIGFTAFGSRKNYYPTADGKEDAQLFTLDMTLYRTTHSH
jgi:ribosomal-protein-alanine N-acetyltransferase